MKVQKWEIFIWHFLYYEFSSFLSMMSFCFIFNWWIYCFVRILWGWIVLFNWNLCRTITELTCKLAFNAATELLIEQLIQDVCTSDADCVCRGVFTTDVTERLEALAACQKSVERLHLGRAFRKWKAQFSGNGLLPFALLRKVWLPHYLRTMHSYGM